MNSGDKEGSDGKSPDAVTLLLDDFQSRATVVFCELWSSFSELLPVSVFVVKGVIRRSDSPCMFIQGENSPLLLCVCSNPPM